MKKGKYEKAPPKRAPWVLVVVIVLVAVSLILVAGGFRSIPAVHQHSTNSTSEALEKNPDSIAIPGYEMLELKAGTKKQALRLPNPPQNCCYFKIALLLEDGTLLWESNLIKPGSTSKPIVLSKALAKGTYPNAILRYSCYRMDDVCSPLNGAETKLTLWVK